MLTGLFPKQILRQYLLYSEAQFPLSIVFTSLSLQDRSLIGLGVGVYLQGNTETYWTDSESHSTQKEPIPQHANSIQKELRLGFKPRTFLLKGTSATSCSTLQIRIGSLTKCVATIIKHIILAFPDNMNSNLKCGSVLSMLAAQPEDIKEVNVCNYIDKGES